MDQWHKAAKSLFGGKSKITAVGLICKCTCTIWLPADNEFRLGFNEGAVAILTLPERFFSLLALCNILYGSDQAQITAC
jgi:hypothetical protein